MARRVPDIRKIQQLTGYTPQVGLDEMLERVIDYWSSPAPVPPSTVAAAIWHYSSTSVVH
jgi:hypothetical protein